MFDDSDPPQNQPTAVEALPRPNPRPAEGELQFTGQVVGIGASAGGLDALERLFGALPDDTGAAFVVIQHLSPDHKSMMDNLLSRYTAMPVRVAEHGMALAPNTVFLLPPAKSMRMAGDRLLLSPKPDHGLSLPIDVFFGSMAEHCADRGVAVVLSGTGSDGSRGAAAVNAAGGFVFVQEPGSAKFDGMPRSAIGTGLVDVVAPAEALADRLAGHLRVPRTGKNALRLSATVAAGGHEEPLEGIFELLLSSSGIDFRDYKPSTLLRRIERRMYVLGTPTLEAYREALAISAGEQAALRRELLIPVTQFFRDREAFEQVALEVITPLLEQRDALEPIRVWTACCATGEEAYSLAILFAEAFRRTGRQRTVKIFATDVEPQYLDFAAAGHYAGTIAAEVSAERLDRYFLKVPDGWCVRPEIRQMVIFARHNLVADPPFTRIDLVSCRNALIYLQAAPQERALRRLEYALAAGGHLFLGPSESLGVLQRSFVPLPGRNRIYKLVQQRSLLLPQDGSPRHRTSAHLGPQRWRGTGGSASAAAWVNQAQQALLRAYAPPSLLVGPGRELLHVVGGARELLQIADGDATLDVTKLLPREVGWTAGLLMQAVADPASRQTSALVHVGEGAQRRHVRLVVRRIGDAEGAGTAACMLLTFEPVDAGTPAPEDPTALDVEQRLRVETLERELDLTHENLQATIEELETANEELQATNEELMASNEELQSTNEELQSVNEELYTVNSEYQEKVDVLNSVNADLENIAKATGTPTLFVDQTLKLLRFTPELMQLFKVREGDRGRSIEDFAHLLDYPELHADLRRTLDEQNVTEREVKSRDGQWWLARIQPYVARSPGDTRAVMSFVNVTSLKDSQRTQAILDSLSEHVAVLDPQGNIVRVNAAWRRFAAGNGDPELRHCGVGSNYLQVSARAALLDPGARAAYEGLLDVLEGRRASFSTQYPCDIESGRLWFLMHAAPVQHPGGGAVVSHIDITSWAGQATRSGGSPAPLR